MRKRTAAQWIISIALYCLGMLCLAFGVAFSANAGLGISPVNSLPYVVASCLGIGAKVGTVVTAVFCFYILLQFIILRKDFKPFNLLQIAFSTIFGYFVTFAKNIMGSWRIMDGYAGSLIMLAISIVVVALGVFIYVSVDVIPMPMEGLTMAISQKVKKPFSTTKTVVDCSVVALGLILSLVILKNPFQWIREGTILSALVTGYIVAFFRKSFGKTIAKLAYGGDK
ncbi:MAG: hypothetical protein IJM08_06585 [Firmicutes bacterium]|nr:hypothetical protein [Bacillota bacterium]